MAEKGIYQSDLAEVLKLSYTALSHKITGKNQFTEKEIKTIADYFNVDVSFLFY